MGLVGVAALERDLGQLGAGPQAAQRAAQPEHPAKPLGPVADLGADQTGFAEQRADAREWFDGLLLAAYQGGGQSQAFEGVPTWGRSSLLSDPWLAGILAAGGLVLAGPRGRKAVKANVYHALAQVFRTKLAPGDKYAIYGDLYARKASKEAKTLIAEVDTNADGVADLALPLCVSNTRRG